MNFITILLGSVTNILVKMLMNALGEKQLAKILFSVLTYFAAKTATDIDDKLVTWAKTLYPDGETLEQHVEAPTPAVPAQTDDSGTAAAFILSQNQAPLQN